MIKVKPYPNFYANLVVDGDKSTTIRALLLSAVAKGETKITNALFSKDTLNAINCVKQLGAKVFVDKKNKIITVNACEKIANNKRFYCGNSGTLARLLIGLLAGAGVNATVCGDASLSKRPMSRVVSPLEMRGAKINSKSGCLPIKIYPSTLTELNYVMQVDSAQVKSALLLSGLTSGAKTVVTERNLTRDHTEKMLEYLGADITVLGKQITLNKSSLIAKNIQIFSDPSSSAYYLTIGLLKGEVTVENLLASPLRTAFISKLKNHGAKFEIFNRFESCGEQVFSVTAYKSEIEYFEINQTEVPALIDELPLLAVIACFNNGAKIQGVSELRVKESDRLKGTVNLVKAIGGMAFVSDDILFIEKVKNINAFDFESDDHRMILCAHVAMLLGRGGNINGENSIQISFPTYFKNLEKNAFALIGENVKSSLSGIIHKHILSEMNFKNFCYVCVSLPCESLSEFFNKCAYKAINVTIPYKNEMQNYIKNQTKLTKKANTVNFIYKNKGYSFDGAGLVSCIRASGIPLKNKKVLLYGTGGAGRSIALEFLKAGATVYLQNRTKQNLQSFLNSINSKKLLPYLGESCDIVINATCEKQNPLFSDEQIKNAKLVIDINYAKQLRLADDCERLNVEFKNGLEMLFYQAYYADCKIAGEKFDKNKAQVCFKRFKEKYENLCS